MDSGLVKTLIGSALSAALSVIGVVVTNYRNRKKLERQQELANAQAETRHQEWMKKTDARMEEAESRLDEHSDKFDDYVKRDELERSLEGIRSLVHSTDTWLRTMLPLLLGRVMPGGFMPAVPEEKTKS